MVGRDVVDSNGGTHKQVAACPEEPAGLDLRLPPVHFALVVVVVALVIAYSPEIGGEGIEVDGVVDALAVAGKDVGAPHAYHVEAHRRDVAEYRHVARRQQAVGRRGVIQARGHEPQAQLGVGAVVRAAYHREVEALVLLLLVGVAEVVEKPVHQAALPGHSRGVVLLLGHALGQGRAQQQQ